MSSKGISNSATEEVLRLANQMFQTLGGGLGQRVYVNALNVALDQSKLSFDANCEFAVMYLDEKVGTIRSDFFIEHQLAVWIVEGKISEDQKKAYQNMIKAAGLGGGLVIELSLEGLVAHKL